MLGNREIIRFGLRQFRENLGITLVFQLLHVFSLFLAGLFFAGIGLLICRPLFLFSEARNSGTVRVAILSFIAIFIAFFAILLLFFTISCALGSYRFYLKLAFGRELNLFELFYGFSHREHFLRFAGVNLLVVLLSCPFLIPLLIQKLKGISINLWILELLGLIFFTVVTLFLAMAALASANDERLTAISSLRLSIRMMSRRKLKYFALLLPFAVLMYLLSLIFHGFFNIFFVPLVNTIVSVFFLSAYSEDFPAGTELAGTEPGGESLREEKEFFENGEQRQEAEESGERREEILEESKRALKKRERMRLFPLFPPPPVRPLPRVLLLLPRRRGKMLPIQKKERMRPFQGKERGPFLPGKGRARPFPGDRRRAEERRRKRNEVPLLQCGGNESDRFPPRG